MLFVENSGSNKKKKCFFTMMNVITSLKVLYWDLAESLLWFKYIDHAKILLLHQLISHWPKLQVKSKILLC